MVVGSGFSAFGSGFSKEAFIWTAENGVQSLTDILISEGVVLTGWELREALGVFADGQTIVGTGINPDGNSEGL